MSCCSPCVQGEDSFSCLFVQGACSKMNCPYLHVKLEPGARVCEAFLRGWCPDGVACRQKHLTPDMVQQLRRERILRPGAQVVLVWLVLSGWYPCPLPWQGV
jgi:Zinc finger C-x8-C-x5-C-x3-H type (and similar)